METFEWSVWIVVLVLAIGLFSISSHKDPGVGQMSKGLVILIGAGLAITLITGLSKLHLLWWLPLSYILNMYVTSVQFKRSLQAQLEDEGGIAAIQTEDTDPAGQSISMELDQIESDLAAGIITDKEAEFRLTKASAELAVSKRVMMNRLKDLDPDSITSVIAEVMSDLTVKIEEGSISTEEAEAEIAMLKEILDELA